MPSVSGSWVDSVRDHWRVLLSVLVLVVVMGLYSMQTAPVVLADACGTAPDWWTLDYISYLSCEAQNGGASTAAQAVFSPMLNNIDTDVQGMTNTLNNTLGGMPGQIGASVAGALLPQSGDTQPLVDEWTTIQQTPAIQTVTTSFSAIQDFSTALSAVPTNQGAPTSSAFPSGSYMYGGTSYSVGVPDNFVLGMTWFFAWLSNGGLSRDVLYGLEDAILSLVLASTILGDLGVNIGQITGTVRAYDMALGDGAEEVRQNKAWRDYGRAQVWARHNKAASRASKGSGGNIRAKLNRQAAHVRKHGRGSWGGD